MPPISEKVVAIASAVRDAGGRALLVGGCVLDQFGTVNVVGEAFTVYKLGSDLDVSLPRRERKSGTGHRGFVIEGDPSMTIEDAARRRDFTINAILQDPLTGEIIDPFAGREDINKKILRAVSRDTFS